MTPVMTLGAVSLDALHLILFLALGLAGFLFWQARQDRRLDAERATETLEAAGREAALRLDAARREIDAAEARAADLDQQLKTQRAVADELRAKAAAAEARREEDDKRFAELAQSVMERATGQFMQIANETFEKHKAGAKGDLEKLMEPISQTFKDFRARVDAIEKARTEEGSTLKEQIAAISEGLRRSSDATGKLVTALSAPRGGGSWGEESLRNVMELAGMSAFADFQEQVHDRTEEGTRKPDVIIRMPGGREIVIDAKVSVDDFLKATEETDETQRRQYLATHARKMRDQVKRLSGKAYWKDFEDRVDFVAMYVPGEQIYSAALEADRELFDFAARNKVIIVTPATLIALAKAVAYGWRQEESARNAREAANIGRQLYDSLTAMGGHVEKLGRSLGQSASAYNAFVGSLERNVLSKARKFETLQIAQSGEKALSEPTLVEETLCVPDRSGELRFDDDDNMYVDAAE